MIRNPTKIKTKNRGATNIFILGFVSLFIDMSTEMVYPVLPLFLVALGTAPALIGVIEGISESIAAFLRVASGYVSDKTSKKKTLAILGYSAAFLYKVLILLSSGWFGILIAKIVDRTGKGIRTAPRDSLIAEAGGAQLGNSFGIHKMLDMLGSALGVLLAYLILSYDYAYKAVFIWSLAPALIGVSLLFFVKEVKNIVPPQREKFAIKNIKLPKRLWFYLVTVFIFSVGNSSNAFLLLKAQSNGFDDKTVLLVYLAFNLSASLLSIPFGKISDKFGRRPLIVSGYILYALVYLGFALFTQSYMMFVLFVVYGIYSAMLTGAEKALMVEMAPPHLKGTALGLQGMAQGIGLFISSIIAGLLWQFVGNNFPFY
ncbi:MAG: MFS transporter, partial [Clostridia bacterium]